ncbi:citrate/2-methylcitrate synthase [Variovorax paradoxus]|uniref:citrate/2-methylcitrate synthase n=1 Tax=Variovorax paradoxus TaxID=34073 RepID=UPI003ECD43FC
MENPPSDSRDFLSSTKAMALLGVRRQTLYAYVSRGLVRSVLLPGSRRRGYAKEDLLKLHARAVAKSGHGPVAASAMNWGSPIVHTCITEVTPAGPVYRGHGGIELASAGVGFERVAELLWTGRLPPESSLGGGRARSLIDDPPMPVDAMKLFPHMARALLAASAVEEDQGEGTLANSWMTSNVLLDAACQMMPRHMLSASAPQADGVVSRLFGFDASTPAGRLVNAALVLLADHELSPSTFAARVAASCGASLQDCLLSALSTASGDQIAGVYDRVHQFLNGTSSAEELMARFARKSVRGEAIAGFDHPLYPGGDPRATYLLAAISEIPRLSSHCASLLEFAETLHKKHGLHARQEYAVVAMCVALKLPPYVAKMLFVIGRSAGWIAHVYEQREAPLVLRPRAQYHSASLDA